MQGVEYDNAGNLKKITYANGIVTNITPDVRNRMDIMTVTLGATNLLKLDYTYDGEGNVSNLLTTADGQPTFTDSFGYDGLERLTSFTFNGTTTTYGYDNAGNRTTRNGTTIWAYNDANQLTAISGVTVTHDGSGNMTQKPRGTDTYVYAYDDEDRLFTATKAGSTVETNVYDGLGRRVKRTEGATETLYLYRGNDVAATISNGVTTAYVRLDGRLFASHDSAGTRLYYHPDHLGSNRLVTTSSGTVQGRLSYLPYGEERSSSGTPGEPRFTGKTQDTSTALQYYGARYYDPELGRFITLDPVRDGLNWYVYANDNPLRYVDPTGHYPKPVSGFFEKVGCVLTAGRSACEAAKRYADDALELATELFPGQTWNGQGDAFRHSYWNALMEANLDSGDAKKIASGHEKWHYNDPVPEQVTDVERWRNMQRTMDDYNNNFGRAVGMICGDDTDCMGVELRQAVEDGMLLTIEMDQQNPFDNTKWEFRWSDGAEVIWIDGKPTRE